MDLNNLLKLAGLAAQTTAAKTEAKDGVPGKANTRPDPKIFPDGPSNLGSVSDTSLRRYLKAKGQPVSVEETTYPNLQIEEMLESYVAYTAEKAKNPYAIGMASAMKSTGDKPPLKKSTINKAHKIAKGIDESSLDEAGARPRWNLEGNKTYMVGGNLNYDDKMEYPLSLEDAAILNKYLDQADDAEKRKIWNLFWDHEEMGHEPEGPELAIQYAKDAMGMNESDEATSGTYARVIYDYSEDFGMITLYNNGNKIDEWSGYFGVGTVGNPLADKFVEIAKKNNLNPEGMNIVDDEGETGTFGNNTFNWDQFAKDETGMNESINESYISDLTRVLKNSGQLLNEAGGIGGGLSGAKPGAGFKAQALLKPKANAPAAPSLGMNLSTSSKPATPTADKPFILGRFGNQTAVTAPKSATPTADKPFILGRFGNQAAVTAPKSAAPAIAARPEGPAAGMPLGPKTWRDSDFQAGGARPAGPAAGMPAAPKPAIAARPEGPAASMPKAPPQPASFKDAFRAARKAAGGAGGVFMWNGKPYQTNIKGEPAQAWNSKNLKQVGNWSASESADVDGVAVNEAVAKIACTKCDEVSTAAAWNKNHDTCPKCKTSKQGVAEAAKPDFLDMDKDGNKKEPMKKALKDKEKVSESISYLKRLAGL